MALTKVQADGVNLGDDFAFSGNVTGAGLTSPLANSVTSTSEGGAATTNIVQGLAKVFGNSAADASLRDSFGIASSSDEGTGRYRFNFTNNLSSDNFAVLTSNNGSTSAEIVAFQSGSGERRFSNVRDQTTARYGIQPNGDGSGSATDCAGNYHAIHGDLA
tara:strand:+ start:28 stop:510 length:483 start_codon:yes stop_codon:yes gene_type:complete